MDYNPLMFNNCVIASFEIFEKMVMNFIIDYISLSCHQKHNLYYGL